MIRRCWWSWVLLAQNEGFRQGVVLRRVADCLFLGSNVSSFIARSWATRKDGYSLLSSSPICRWCAGAKFHLDNVIHSDFVKIDNAVDLDVVRSSPLPHLLHELCLLSIHIFSGPKVCSDGLHVGIVSHATKTL